MKEEKNEILDCVIGNLQFELAEIHKINQMRSDSSEERIDGRYTNSGGGFLTIICC